MRIRSNGNVGINTSSPQQLLDVEGSIIVRAAEWNSGGTKGLFFRDGYTTSSVYNCSILTIDHSGDGFWDGLSINGFDGISFCPGFNNRSERMRIDQNGNVGINTSSNCQLTVGGVANIHNGSPYAVSNSRMQSGSLTIRGTNANYGGGSNWSSNTAGLLLERADNTEIAVHDSGTRIASLMYYTGGGSNAILVGRDMGWGTTPMQIMNYLYVSGAYTQIYNLYAGTGNASVGYSGAGLLYWGGGNIHILLLKIFSAMY